MFQLTTFRLYLLGLALLFAGYVTLEYNRPQPLDWSPTYANKDKIPYGTYALYDQLPRLLGTDSIEAVRLPIYSQLTGQRLDEAAAIAVPAVRDTVEAVGSNSPSAAPEAADSVAANERNATATDGETARQKPAKTGHTTAGASTSTAPTDAAANDDESPAETGNDEDSNDRAASPALLRAGPANYLFINQSFELSRPDAHALLQFVALGNDVFVAMQSLSSPHDLLRRRLGFDVQDVDLVTHKGPQGLPVPDSVDLQFTNPALAGVRTRLPGVGVAQRLVVDADRAGRTLATDAQGRAVLVRLDYGRGHFYVCTAPVAFTNYFLLRPRTAGFAAGALSYLPARRTFWDEFQKQGSVGEQSLLRVVFAHDALRLAYYLTLVGGLLFVLVAARRRQRIIPTLKPLPNTTLLFTRTVAGLYRQGRSHALIAEKKVGLFMDYLRTRFHESSPDFADADFRERLSQKSGVPRPRVDELLRLVNFARTAPRVTDQELLKLSKALSNFRREASG